MMETTGLKTISRLAGAKNKLLRRLLLLVNIMVTSAIGYSQCTSPITTFPIYSDFETGTSGWIQDASDDFDWTRDSGGTTSGGTGPINGTNSGADGSAWYMYTEASNPNDAGKTANLISPCFKLAPGTVSSVSFSYHMLGTVDLGTLQLDISTDAGATWTTLWSKLGSQGSSWLTDNVSLDAYEGLDVQIRYGVTTNTFRCDFALDNISINSFVSVPEICNNNFDDDGDGLVDSEDPDCFDFCTVDCTTPYRFDWYDGSSGPQWPITNGETSLTRVYPIAGELGTYNVSVTLTNDDGQNIDLSNCGTAGNHFYTATCNDPNAAYDCDGDPAVVDGQFTYDCNFLTFGITSNNSDESVSITYSFEIPSQICGLQIGDIDYQGSGAGNEGSWQDEIEIEASRNGVPVGINATVGAAVNAINNNTSNLILRSDFDTTSGGNINQNDAAGHAYITTLEKVTSITFKYSNGPEDDGLSDDHAIRINGFDFCPVVPDEICNNAIDDDGDGLVDQYDPDCPCTAAGIPNLDFNNDTNGNPLVAGTNASEIYAAWGIHISTTNVPSANYPPMIFDSYNPTGGDTDLGTPNSDFGGPGIGDGGKAGRIGENNANQGNVLIVSSNGAINDWSAGGTIIFDFDSDVDIASLEIIDFDYGNVDGNVRAFNAGNNLIEDRTIYACGDNCYQKINLSLTGVRRLEVNSTNSFSISSVNFCDDDLPVSSIGDFVWFDTNQDGSSAGESGIEGIKVRLYDNASNLFAETITNSAGGYIFDNLAPGQYRVSIDPPSAYTATGDLDADNDNDSGVFTLAAEQARTDVDFGLYSSISCIDNTPDIILACTGEVAPSSYDLPNSSFGSTWSLLYQPSGSTAIINGSTGTISGLDVPGQYVAALNGGSCTDTVEVVLPSCYIPCLCDGSSADGYADWSALGTTTINGPIVNTFSAPVPGHSTIQVTQTLIGGGKTNQTNNNFTTTNKPAYSALGYGNVYNEPMYIETAGGGSVEVKFDFAEPMGDFDLLIFDIDEYDNLIISAVDTAGNTISDISNWIVRSTGDATISAGSSPAGTIAPPPTIDLSIGSVSSADAANYNRNFVALRPDIILESITLYFTSTVGGNHVYYDIYGTSARASCTDAEITLNSTVSGCIDQALRDVAEVTVDVSWPVNLANDSILVQYDGQTRIIDVANGAVSPQTINFVTQADGSTNNAIIAKWKNVNVCESIDLFDAPGACSNDELSCSILYLCGLDKPYDGDAWDHGWVTYLDEVNGSNSITPILTKNEAGMGTYDVMNPNTFVNLTLSDYDMIIISGTTENHISSDLVSVLRDAPNSIMVSNYAIIGAMGMSSDPGSVLWGTEAWTSPTTEELLLTYNNPNGWSSPLFTKGNYSNEAIATLWSTANGEATTNNGIIFRNDASDPLTGAASTHGNRIYMGYHFNGIYANDENGGALPAPADSWFVPEKHLTLKGKELFDQALIYAGTNCVDEICNDGKDNDGDGSVDSDDLECYDCTEGILVNPGFDDGLVPWDNYNGVATVEVEANGNKFVKVSGGSGGIGQYVTIAEGDTIRMSFFARKSGITSFNAGISFYDASLTLIGVEYEFPVDSDAYTRYEVEAVAPANVAYVKAFAFKDDVGGAAYLDGFCLEAIPVLCTSGVSTITADQSICEGATAIIEATGGGSYHWDNSLGSGATHAVSPASTTTYNVTVTSSIGCTEVATTTVTVSPSLSVSIDFNGTICLEDNSQLTALPSGGTPGFTYSWTGPSSFTSTSQTIDAAESGNYYITVTDGAGCTAETSGFIYAAFEPFIFSLETSVCEGESVDLEINGSNIASYAWDSNAGNATTAAVTVTPIAPASTYVVTVTNNNGCTSTATATIGANALPLADAGPNISVCEGVSQSFTGSDAGAGATYSWSFGANATPSSATGRGPHNVSYNNPNTNGSNRSNTAVLSVQKDGCTNTDSKNITIYGQPDPTITFSSPSCGVDDGSITFNFVDNPNRTTINFSVDGGSSYPYSVNDNTGSYTVNNLPSGNYPIYTIWGNGQCPVDLGSIALENNEIPTLTPSSVNICLGSSSVVTSTTSGTWSSSDETVATVSASGIVTGVGAGTAEINFTGDNNCAASNLVLITVEEQEGVTLTGDNLLCEGETTTLTSSKNGGTWSSDNTSVATVNSSGVVTAVSVGVVLIYYIHPANSCTEESNISIEVFATPVVSISGSVEVCVGETTTLSTDGTGGFWTSSDNSIAIVSSTGIVSGIAAGTATFYYTTADGCPSDNTGTLTVTPAVSVSIDFNGSQCLTEDSKLSAVISSGTSGYTFLWTGPGGFSGNTQTVDISLDGNYSVIVTDSKGCSDDATAFIYESYEPFIFALNTTVCEGESVTLSVSGASATGYQWSASAGNAATQSVTVVPSVPSTSYTVTVTNSIGCTTEATANIMVDAKPVVSVVGSTDICIGQTTQLSPSTGGTWTSANSSVASVSAAGVVTGVSNGTTTFTFKSDATSCVSNATEPITVGANGSVAISGDSQICFGDNTTLTASVTGGIWSSANTSVATIDPNGVVTPQGQGTTTITYDVGTGGCFDDGTYSITINADPVVSLNGSSTICEGDNTFVNASVSGSWTSSDEAVATISSTGVITGEGAGSATISFTSNAGCTKDLATPITVVGSPTVVRLGPADICINSTTSLSPISGGLWISSNNSVASVNSSGVVTGKGVGTAIFTFIESTNGCVSDETISINVSGPPSINGLSDSEICIGENTTITPSTGGAWTSSNNGVATITNGGVITAISAGSARFTFTSDATGCSSQLSAPLTVNPSPTVTFDGPMSICEQQTTNILPSSGGVWSSSDVSVATIQANGEITATGAGIVYFTWTSNATGCSSNPSGDLTVQEPTGISVSGPDAICIGAVTNLLPNSGGSWSSSNANIATISTNGEVVGVNPGIATFTFDSATGCSSDPSTEITIHQNPSPVFTGPIDLCVGGTTQVGPATGGTWSSSDNGVATIDGSGNVTAISAGVATFTYKDNNTGCEETTVSSLNVYDKPVPTIVGDDMICIGFSTYLQPNSGGVWTSSNPSVAIISSSGQVTGVTAGTATFTFYENGSTCVSDASDPITVAPKEPVSITGANTICINSTTSVQPSVGGSWISSNASVATVTDDGQVTGKSQGIARFTFISDEGCSSNQTAPVIVYGPPSISIDGDNQLCAGGSLQMLPSTGGTWTSNNEGVATISNGGLVTAVTTGTVRFTYTESATGCSSAESELITINDSPETSVNGPDNICIGGVTNLTPTTGGIWTSINPDKATIQNNGQVTGVAVGEARFVFMQLSTGCISDTTAVITINGGPAIAFDGPTEICVGETTSITPSTGGTWQSTNPQIASINSAGEITGLAAGAVKFQYTETGTGCKSAFSETLVVNGLPTVSLAGSPFVCVGTTTHLSPSSGGSWISLTPGVASVTSTGIVTGVGEGEAFFQFVDAVTGCESDGSLSVSVQDAITAEVVGDTEICAGYTTSLFPSSGGVWTSSNSAVAKVSNFGTVTGVAPGVVTFTFTDSNSGCANTSTTDPITVSQCINHDFNVALVNQNITGDLSTNDLLPVGSTYSNIKITVQKPNASLSTLTIAPDGSYTFVTNKPGKYLYKVSACIPPSSSGCPSAFLEINVVDDVYGTSNPISNLEFATTYTDNDAAVSGQAITIQPIANDACVYTGGCGLDATTVAVTDLPQNGTATAHADGTIVYTPDAGFVGHDTIYYEICVLGEAKCSQSMQVVTVNHTSAPNSVVAADDFTFTLKGTEVTGNLSANDMDPEGDHISVTQQGSLVAPVVTANGSYYINNDGTYGFTPNDNFSGAMDIVYTICDDGSPSACMSATLHIQVFDDLALQVRVYLEGSLMQNGNQISIDGRPLMRDGLRLSGYDGERHIPVKDPYTYYTELFDLTPDMFTKMGPGLTATNMEVLDSTSVFGVSGDNAIVDWVFVEIRDKNDSRTVIATRSGLVQRDGDVVDLDGVSPLRFQGINVDSFYLAVRHRTHLGVMSQKVRNGALVDFTSPSTPTFNFGNSLGNGSDYTGLSQNSAVKSGWMALWAGDFNSDRVVKFTEPASDQNILFGNVLFTSPSFLINYDFTYGYFKGDYNMDGKAKFTNPDDDTNYLLAQIIFYRENTSYISNFAQMIEQIPNHE